jgi:methyl-accepting chemotaxis protein
MLAVFLAAILGAAGAGWLLTRAIVQPLRRTMDYFDRISEGRYDNAIQVDRHDEIGRVLKALANMQVRLGFDVAEAKRVSNENLRIRKALDKASTNMMIADNDRRNILYLNESVRVLFGTAEADIRKELPNFAAAGLLGANIDVFHKDPARIRRMIEAMRGEHRASIRLGGRTFSQITNPVFDADGARIGTVVEWNDLTAQVAAEAELAQMQEAALAGDFSGQLALAGKDGFFRELAERMNQLNRVVEAGLTETAVALKAMAAGDLTRHVEGEQRGLFGRLKDDTNACIDNLRRIVGEIIESADVGATLATDELASGNIELSGAHGADQASSLEETASGHGPAHQRR